MYTHEFFRKNSCVFGNSCVFQNTHELGGELMCIRNTHELFDILMCIFVAPADLCVFYYIVLDCYIYFLVSFFSKFHCLKMSESENDFENNINFSNIQRGALSKNSISK